MMLANNGLGGEWAVKGTSYATGPDYPDPRAEGAAD